MEIQARSFCVQTLFSPSKFFPAFLPNPFANWSCTRYLYLYINKADLIKSPTVYVFTTAFEMLKAKFVSVPVIEEWHHLFTFLVYLILCSLFQSDIMLVYHHAALPRFSVSPPSFPRPISRTFPTQPFLLLVLSLSPPFPLLLATFSLVLLDRSFDPVPSEHREVPGGGDDLLSVRVPGHVPDDPLVSCQLFDNLPGEQIVDDDPAGGTASVDVPGKQNIAKK